MNRFEQKRMTLFQRITFALLFLVCILLVVVLLPVNEGETARIFIGRSKAFFSPRYNTTYPLTKPTKVDGGWRYQIAVVADPDTNSKVEGKELWKSYLLKGHATVTTTGSGDYKLSVTWDKDLIPLETKKADGGRGAELSELVVFDGRLLTVDDRSGIVFELYPSGSSYLLIPWIVLADGDGHTVKGYKGEWMTVKNTLLYVGGLGKVWTTTTGEVVNANPQFVKAVWYTGHVDHISWVEEYEAMMNSVGIQHPGYVIHESGCWSPHHNKWFFLPRRASKETYNDELDEHRATNIMFVCEEDFSRIEVKTVGEIDPYHGFSSFKFVPGTQDRLILAIKSEENKGKIASYVMAFTSDGDMVMNEQKILDGYKFEGIEFI